MLPVCLFLALAQSPTFELQPVLRSGADRDRIAGAQVKVPPLLPLDAKDARREEWGEETLVTSLEVLGKSYPFLVEERTADDPPEHVWLDVDGDGHAAPEEVLETSWRALAGTGSVSSVSFESLGIPAGLNLYYRGDRMSLTLMTRFHLEGTVEVHGETLRCLWIDMDVDGRVTPGVDRWLALEAEHLELVSLANGMMLARETDEPWYRGSRILTMREVRADGTVVLETRTPELSRSAFLAARAARVQEKFFPWFESERAAFFEQWEIAVDRPQAEAPLSWHYAATFEEAMDHAAKLDRPLFVEFTTDACPWCKRLEWLNYRDAEIADRLREYALVKIHVDLDPGRTAERLGLQGVPKGVFFHPDGEPAYVVSGWSPPAGYLRQLDEAAEALLAR